MSATQPLLNSKSTAPLRATGIRSQGSISLGPVQSIALEEAQRAGITYAQIIGEQRARKCVGPRHYAMWRAARETGASLVAIGRVFNDRDHSTVIHAIHKVERMRARQVESASK